MGAEIFKKKLKIEIFIFKVSASYYAYVSYLICFATIQISMALYVNLMMYIFKFYCGRRHLHKCKRTQELNKSHLLAWLSRISLVIAHVV